MFVRLKKYKDLIEAMSREQSRHNETTFQRNQLLNDVKILGDLAMYYKAKSERLEKDAIAREKNGRFCQTYNNNR